MLDRLSTRNCGFVWLSASVVGLSAQQPSLSSEPPSSVVSRVNEVAEIAEGTETSFPRKNPREILLRPLNSVQHVDLDAAWKAYDSVVGKAVATMRATIAKEIDVAAAKGDLAVVEKWQAASEQFEQNGVWPSGASINGSIKAIRNGLASAVKDVEQAYSEATTSMTKEKEFEKARAVKDEWEKVTSELMGGEGRSRSKNSGTQAEKQIIVTNAVFGSGKAAVDVTQEFQSLAADPARTITVTSDDLRQKNKKGYFRDKLVIRYQVDGVEQVLTIQNGEQVNLFTKLRANN